MYWGSKGEIEDSSICFDLGNNTFRGGMVLYDASPIAAIHDAGGFERVAMGLVEEIIGPEFHLLGSWRGCRCE